MAKKRKGRPTFIRDWREHRHLTQQQLADRLDKTQATIARIERGDIAYTQPVLEAMADALNCQPWDLIWRPPGTSDKLRDALAGVPEADQAKILHIIQAFKTGTEG